MELMKKYLNKLENHLFKREREDTFKKIFPVTINGTTYALGITWTDKDLMSVRLTEASNYTWTTPKGKECIGTFFKHMILFPNAYKWSEPKPSKFRSVAKAKYYKPLMDYVREKITQNEEELSEVLKKQSFKKYEEASSYIDGWLRDRPYLYKPNEKWLEKVRSHEEVV